MAASKITIDNKTLKQQNLLIKSNFFANRRKAIQQAGNEKLMSMEKIRLVEECTKLDPEFEQLLAEEGFSSELKEWPEY